MQPHRKTNIGDAFYRHLMLFWKSFVANNRLDISFGPNSLEPSRTLKMTMWQFCRSNSCRGQAMWWRPLEFDQGDDFQQLVRWITGDQPLAHVESEPMQAI